MTLPEAIEVLKTHNDWRTGKHDNQTEPKLLTEALEIAIKLLEPMIPRPCSCAYGHKKKNYDECGMCGGTWSNRIKPLTDKH